MGCPKFFAGSEYRAPLHRIKWDLVRRHFPSRLMRKAWKKRARAEAILIGKMKVPSMFFLEVCGRCHAGTSANMTHRFHKTLSLLFKYINTSMTFIFQRVWSGQTCRPRWTLTVFYSLKEIAFIAYEDVNFFFCSSRSCGTLQKA